MQNTSVHLLHVKILTCTEVAQDSPVIFAYYVAMNNMSYLQVKKLSAKDRSFEDAAWREVDEEHYGADKNINWKKEVTYFVARNGSETIGTIKLSHSAGVGKISEVIVAKAHRGQGVGRELMDRAEDWLKQQGVHKVWLTTRREWNAYKVYLGLGYEDSATLEKHYTGLDFVLMTKFFD